MFLELWLFLDFFSMYIRRSRWSCARNLYSVSTPNHIGVMWPLYGSSSKTQDTTVPIMQLYCIFSLMLPMDASPEWFTFMCFNLVSNPIHTNTHDDITHTHTIKVKSKVSLQQRMAKWSSQLVISSVMTLPPPHGPIHLLSHDQSFILMMTKT